MYKNVYSKSRIGSSFTPAFNNFKETLSKMLDIFGFVRKGEPSFFSRCIGVSGGRINQPSFTEQFLTFISTTV